MLLVASVEGNAQHPGVCAKKALVAPAVPQ